jgi:hypothetical protein
MEGVGSPLEPGNNITFKHLELLAPAKQHFLSSAVVLLHFLIYAIAKVLETPHLEMPSRQQAGTQSGV